MDTIVSGGSGALCLPAWADPGPRECFIDAQGITEVIPANVFDRNDCQGVHFVRELPVWIAFGNPPKGAKDGGGGSAIFGLNHQLRVQAADLVATKIFVITRSPHSIVLGSR
ncbi:MAG: hypothetical protein ACREQ4_16250 [Candidatus Binataceae bacterium]